MEIERLQTLVAEAGSEREQELARLQEERTEVATELERLHAALAEEQRRHAGERDELNTQRELIREELGAALEQLAVAGPAAEERDGLRTEIARLESTFAETQAATAAEHERLLAEVARLESIFAEMRGAHEEELGRLRKKRDRAREQLDGLQTALAEAQTTTAERERRLAEEQERHAGERDEFNAQCERLQEELGDALERLAALGPAAEERDALQAEVERLRESLNDVRERSAAELRDVVAERDSLTAELEEARELLRQAERVRESQIALEAERDRLTTELERLQAVAAEAQVEAEERSRLLAEEQDLHRADRETLLAQRTVLEQELGSSIEQLAAASAAADKREARLQLGSERLLEGLDAVRKLAAELVTGSEEFPEEPATDEAEPEAVVEDEVATEEPYVETEEIDYSLFVPGPNGYELVPQTGVPPQAGQTVELLLPDQDEPVLFEVVRSGRTLPGGDVCVYLAQV